MKWRVSKSLKCAINGHPPQTALRSSARLIPKVEREKANRILRYKFPSPVHRRARWAYGRIAYAYAASLVDVQGAGRLPPADHGNVGIVCDREMRGQVCCRVRRVSHGGVRTWRNGLATAAPCATHVMALCRVSWLYSELSLCVRASSSQSLGAAFGTNWVRDPGHIRSVLWPSWCGGVADRVANCL